MESYRSEIEGGYQMYLEEYPEKGFIKLGDYDYPFQDMVIEESQGFIGYNSSPLSRDCVIEERDDIPSIGELPMNDLAWLPVGLTRVLKIQRLPDHDELWKLAGDIVQELADPNDPFPESLANNVVMLIHSVLCSDWSVHQFKGDWSGETNKQETLKHSSVLARYAAFPTIEGIAKALCSSDITHDGWVREGRVVRSYSGGDYSGGDQVNSLGHLLYHLETDVAEEPLKSRLQEFRAAVQSFFRPTVEHWSGAYGYLTDRRNSVMHGQRRAQAEFGILLNLLSLLILNIDHIPESRRTHSKN